jgi:transcriptional regulator with XRE-family HTH domain
MPKSTLTLEELAYAMTIFRRLRMVYSQAGLARRIGVRPRTIVYLEHGQRMMSRPLAMLMERLWLSREAK